nr:hypothetical protein [Tanacetum cinerariifolium]
MSYEATSPDNHMSTVDQRLNIMSGRVGLNVKTFFLQGNAIHCSAWSNVVHNFIKLKEGVIYCIKNFVVHPNKKVYRISKDDALMLEFNGATSAKKSLAKAAGFVRHPFQLVELDSVELTDNKYMIGSRTLDFYLANERGQMHRVTLGEGLGDTLIEKKTKDVGYYKLYLSRSSSTQIFNDLNIPTLKELRSEIRVADQTLHIKPVDIGQTRAGTLKNLLLYESTISGHGTVGTSQRMAGKSVRKELAESWGDGDVTPVRKQ